MIITNEREDLELSNLFVFLFGAIIGSFLNVVIIRVPKGESIITPRSHCTKCGLKIEWYFNIPIFSYLLLKGRCIKCGEKFSINYFFVEILSAIVTLLLFLKLGLTYDFFLMLILFYILIVLAFIDFEYKAVPDTILLLAFIVGILTTYNDLILAFKNAFIFAGAFVLLDFLVTYYIQNIKSKITKDESLKEQKALGEGDIPIIAIIGAILGIKAGLVAIFLAALFAIIPSIYNIIKKRDNQTPFIPYLLLGFMSEYLFSLSKGI